MMQEMVHWMHTNVSTASSAQKTELIENEGERIKGDNIVFRT